MNQYIIFNAAIMMAIFHQEDFGLNKRRCINEENQRRKDFSEEKKNVELVCETET